LAAVTVALVNDFPDQSLTPSEIFLPPGRLEPIRLANGAYLLRDDYKSPWKRSTQRLTRFPIPARPAWSSRRRLRTPGSTDPFIGTSHARCEIASKAIFISHSRKGSKTMRRSKTGRTASLLDHQRAYDILRAIEILQRDITPGDVVLIKGRSISDLTEFPLH